MTCLSFSQIRGPARWARAGIEPSLDEILSDPIVGVVMARDAVTADEVRAAMRAATRHRGND
jgi:hypothetical protein